MPAGRIDPTLGPWRRAGEGKFLPCSALFCYPGGNMKNFRLAVRVDEVERAKLETLAAQTKRSLSGVLRLLLAQAEATGHVDVRLGSPGARRGKEDEDG